MRGATGVTILSRHLVDNALVTKVNVRELRVGFFEVELDRAARLRATTSDFGDPVLEATWEIDPHAMLRAAHRWCSCPDPSGMAARARWRWALGTESSVPTAADS